MKYLSDQNRTVFHYESGTYGNTSGVGQWLGFVQEHTVEPNMNVIPIRYQGSTDRNVDDFVDGVKEWNGTITYFPQDWKFLGFAIGKIQDLAGSHIFTETNSNDSVLSYSPGSSYPGPLYTFTIADTKATDLLASGPNFIRTIIGGMVDSYQISLAQGGVISAEVGYIAQDSTYATGSVVAVAATTTKPFMFSDVEMEIGSATAHGTDGRVPNLKEGTFSINNNLERGFYLNGSRMLHELLPMNRDYEFTATCDMDELNAGSFYRYYIAGSPFNSTLKIRASAGVGAGPGSLILNMSGCRMTEMTIPSVLEGVQEQSFTFVPQHVDAIAYDAIGSYGYM